MSPSKTTPLFAQWIAAMGFNLKQVSQAGRLIGMPTSQAVRRNTGAVENDMTELLAMSAVRAGLPPWSPKADAEIAAAGQAVALVRYLVENDVRAPSKTK